MYAVVLKAYEKWGSREWGLLCCTHKRFVHAIDLANLHECSYVIMSTAGWGGEVSGGETVETLIGSDPIEIDGTEIVTSGKVDAVGIAILELDADTVGITFFDWTA